MPNCVREYPSHATHPHTLDATPLARYATLPQVPRYGVQERSEHGGLERVQRTFRTGRVRCSCKLRRRPAPYRYRYRYICTVQVRSVYRSAHLSIDDALYWHTGLTWVLWILWAGPVSRSDDVVVGGAIPTVEGGLVRPGLSGVESSSARSGHRCTHVHVHVQRAQMHTSSRDRERGVKRSGPDLAVGAG